MNYVGELISIYPLMLSLSNYLMILREALVGE
jgi:hypothetical protein